MSAHLRILMLDMKNDFVLRFLLMLAVGIICGIVGMLIGAYLGGNYATNFQLNGVRGYEATSQVGFVVGAALGVFITWKRMKNK
jgi:uncharacterized membrane protein YeaQ/YmgE (transglycosylase-associated protein family)